MSQNYYDLNIETLPHIAGETPGVCGLPEMPFDFLQPTTRQQLTQVGYGGPFVIRGNPIGAILDAIKGFCSPVPMSYDGSTYTDLTDSGLGSYGDYTSPYLGSEGSPYGGPFGSNGTVPAFGSQQCGNGTMWDLPSQMCVPSPMNNPVTPTPASNMCDDPRYASMLATMAAEAFAARDVPMLCKLQADIVACQRTASIPGMKNITWPAVAVAVAGNLKILGCNDCGSCKQNTPSKPSPTGSGDATTPNSGGNGPMNTPNNSGAQNPPSPNAGSGNPPMGPNPFDYIGASHPGGPMGRGDSGNTGVAGFVKNAAARLQNRLPELPNPMSLTEGNIGMLSSPEPMLGMFDPAAANPHTGSPRRNYGNVQTQRQVRSLRGGGRGSV